MNQINRAIDLNDDTIDNDPIDNAIALSDADRRDISSRDRLNL